MKGPPQGPRLHIDIPRVQLLIEDKEGIKQLGKHRALPAAWGRQPCPGQGCGPASPLALRRQRCLRAVPFLPYGRAGRRGMPVGPTPLALLLAVLAAPTAISSAGLCLGGGYCCTAALAGEQPGKSPIPARPRAPVGLPAAGKPGDPTGVLSVG